MCTICMVLLKGDITQLYNNKIYLENLSEESYLLTYK